MLARAREAFKRAATFIKRRDIYTILIIVFVGFASFGLGKLSGAPVAIRPIQVSQQVFENESELETIEQVADQANEIPLVSKTQGSFVGSRNSDKYHYPWCPGALRIKEENKVWFNTREDAEAEGYTPASNCKGL